MNILDKLNEYSNLSIEHDRFNAGKHKGKLFTEFFDVPKGHPNWGYAKWLLTLDTAEVTGERLLADIDNVSDFLAAKFEN